MQVTRVSLDDDTGVLSLSLNTGEEYEIVSPAHARSIYEKISVGGMISDTQKFWLDKFAVQKVSDKPELLDKLRILRKELREIGLHPSAVRLDSAVKNGDVSTKC